MASNDDAALAALRARYQQSDPPDLPKADDVSVDRLLAVLFPRLYPEPVTPGPPADGT